MTTRKEKHNRTPLSLADETIFTEQTQHLLEFSERTQAKASMLFITFETLAPPTNEAHKELIVQSISQALLEKARESDIYAHLDDMNFANLSIQTSAQHATTIAEKLKHELARPLLLADGSLVTLQPKVGIASYPEQGDNYQQLISYAKKMAH